MFHYQRAYSGQNDYPHDIGIRLYLGSGPIIFISYTIKIEVYFTSTKYDARFVIAGRQSDDGLSSGAFSSEDSASINNLMATIISKHTNKQTYSCPECDYKIVYLSFLMKHIRSKHNKDPHKLGIYPYQTYHCTLCDYTCKRNHNIKLHIMSKHTMEKPYQCSQCDDKFISIYNLKRHVISMHTTEKPHS